MLEALRRALPPLQPLHMGSQMPKLSELDATRTIHEGWLFKVRQTEFQRMGPFSPICRTPLFAISQDLIHPKKEKKKKKKQLPFFPYVATPFLPYVNK